MDAARRVEFGALGAAFNRFVEKLAGVIRQIGQRATTPARAGDAGKGGRLATMSSTLRGLVGQFKHE